MRRSPPTVMFRLPSAVPVGPPGRMSLPRRTRLSGATRCTSSATGSNALGGAAAVRVLRLEPRRRPAPGPPRLRRRRLRCAFDSAGFGRLLGAAAAFDLPFGRHAPPAAPPPSTGCRTAAGPDRPRRARRPASRRPTSCGRRTSPVIFSAVWTCTSPSSLSITSKLSESMLMLTAPTCRSWTASSPGNRAASRHGDRAAGTPGSASASGSSSIRVVRPVNVPPAAGTAKPPFLMST